MPDLDRLPRGVRRGWGRVADAVRGDQGPDVVADAIEKAIAKTVRLLTSDLGWLAGLDQAVEQARRSGTIDALNLYVSSLDTRVTRGVEAAFIDEARHLAASSGRHDLRALLVGGLLRMPEKLCLAPLEPDLIGARFASYRELRSYTTAALARVNAGAIADQILRDDFRTKKVRAPRTARERPGTKRLLYAAIR